VAHRGSVARYAWDLAGFDRSGWVVPLGASADPGSPHHHDQLDAWVAGTLLPLCFSQEVAAPGPTS
jgi:penicillin amidase